MNYYTYLHKKILKFFVFILFILSFNILPGEVSAIELLQKKITFDNTTTGASPTGSLVQFSDGMIYGTTIRGGTNNKGTIFQYNPTSGVLTKKIDFEGFSNGSNPNSLTQASNGMIYGITQSGGINDVSIIFQYNPTSGVLTKKIDIGTAYPNGPLIQASDGMLYGMMQYGGTNNKGTLFQYNPTSGVLTTKINFNNTINYGSLTKTSGEMLYLTTSLGGVNNKGTLLEYNITSGVLTTKINFDGTTNGENPLGSLIQTSNGMIYGMNSKGGLYNKGILFSYDQNSGILTKEVDLQSDFYSPLFLIESSDNMVYGGSFQGGDYYSGFLFKYNTISKKLIFKFGFNGATYGQYINSPLLQASDGMLYGTTQAGGSINGDGTLFQYNPLYNYPPELTGILISGNNTVGSLLTGSYSYLDKDGDTEGVSTFKWYRDGIQIPNATSTSYTTTEEDLNKRISFEVIPIATHGDLTGIPFKSSNFDIPSSLPVITTDSVDISNYQYGYGMNDGDGIKLNATIVSDGGDPDNITAGFEYGTDISYGSTYDYGNTNGTGAFQYQSYDSYLCNGTYHFRAYATNFFGTTYGDDKEIIFSFCSITENLTKKIDFDGIPNGSTPNGYLIQASNGMLYGVTLIGGTSNIGTLFEYNPISGVLTKKIDFDSDNGANPYSSLVQASDGMLYGMTQAGGTSDTGTLFQYNPNTGILTKKIDFISDNGSSPQGSLTQASNGMLYGTTVGGGINYNGTLFEYNPTSEVLTKKIDFNSSNGSSPYSSLSQASDGMLYGMTQAGGTSDNGTLFQYNPTSGVLTKKIDFNYDKGISPFGSLSQASDGMLYGMMPYGGINNKGTLFQYNPTSGVLTKKIDFNSDNGANPMGSLSQASDGMLYGMTQYGGTNNKGTLFQYNPIYKTLPSIIISSLSSTSQTSTTLNANITSTGGASVTERGFNYGLTTDYGATVKDIGSYEEGTYSKDISYLTCNTTYHYRAYAINSVGTTNSDDQTFTTSSCPVVSSGGTSSYYRNPTPVVTSTINSIITPTVTPTITIPQTLITQLSTITKVLKPSTKKDNNVKSIQTYLNTVLNLKLTPDGIFGKQTKLAIMKFQKDHNLKQDGIVGPKTLKEMK